MEKTHNGDIAYSHSLNNHLEFFSKAGSLFTKKESFYGNESSALDLFKTSWGSGDEELSFKLLLWLRNIRGGAGNRSAFRSILTWLAENEPEWVRVNIESIPHYGRWDDLSALFNTTVEKEAVNFWADAIREGNGLACKWAPRQSKKSKTQLNAQIGAKKLRECLGLNPKDYRKLIVEGSKNIVENLMSNNEWHLIKYDDIPSKAMLRYNSAFIKHDEDRYVNWLLERVKNGKKINAGAVYPHELACNVRMKKGSEKLYNLLFSSLPDITEDDTSVKAIPIIDTSYSMTTNIGGNTTTAYDVSIGLGLYLSDRLGKNNPFYRNVIPFSTSARFVNWKESEFSDATRSVVDGYMGSTNIESALRLILDSAIAWNVSKEQMPNMIIVLSDMQFNQGTTNSSKTTIESILDEFEEKGYDRMSVVYWNLAGYNTQPANKHSDDVCLVSGFSPSIMKSVLKNEEITIAEDGTVEKTTLDPVTVMLNAIAEYDVNIPQ